MSSYALHPEAFADLDEIWEYIPEDNIDAADRVLTDIHSMLTTLAHPRHPPGAGLLYVITHERNGVLLRSSRRTDRFAASPAPFGSASCIVRPVRRG